jgi:EAL domain-containing protein (putative c-di-GMP-specific phosphodiesterase class I)/DNA-binding NarL/FixJ family response regulator
MSSAPDPIKVLIADDEDSVRDVLRAIIATESDIEVAAEAGDAEAAIKLATAVHPDVAILDVRMPGGGGPRAAREIARRSPPTKIIALSAHEEIDSVLEMLRAGALGYVVKGESTDAIVKAIHRSLEAHSTLPSGVLDDMAHALAEELHRVSDGAMERRSEVSERIARALDGDGMAMAYQPIFDLKGGIVVGMEALARFPAEPARSTDAWLAEAEAVGRLVELELAAIRLALADLDRLPALSYLSLNVSPATLLSMELAAELEDAPLERLVLELTEQARVEDYFAVRDAIADFRADGLRLAVDDAGAGFASLRHIVLLRPDLIKLDRTLTNDVHADDARQALVLALVAFGSRIGAHVVAEGIEREEQLEALRQTGVRFGQGFYLAEPTFLIEEGETPGKA